MQRKRPGFPPGLTMLLMSLFLAENGEEANHRLNALIEIRDMKFLIGGVNVVIGKAEAHQHRWDFQIAAELSDDGDGATGSDIDGLLVKYLVQRLIGGLDVVIVGTDHNRLALGVNLDADLNSLGGN